MTSSSVAAEAAWEHNAKLSAAVAVPAINLDFMTSPPKFDGLPFADYPTTRSKNDALLSNYNCSLTIVGRILPHVTNMQRRLLFHGQIFQEQKIAHSMRA
jgi:hypothetical protein